MSRAQLDLAWAAGLFEGEGSFSWNRQKNGRKYPHAALRMADEDVVRKFAAIIGIGRVSGPFIRPDRKPLWHWRVVGPEAMEHLAATIGPFLGERRSAKLAELLTFRRLRAPDGTWLDPREFSAEGLAALREIGAVHGRVRANGSRDSLGRFV